MDENKQFLEKINIGLYVTYILIGYLGLSVIFTIVSEILTLIAKNVYIDAGTFSALGNFFTYAIATILMIHIGLFIKPFVQYLLKNLKDKTGILEGIIFAVITFACSLSLSMLIDLCFGSVGTNDNQSSLNDAFFAQPFLSFFYIVIFAPICEELTYRFGLFSILSKKSKVLAWTITILIFAFIHFDFNSFNNIEALRVELLNLPVYLAGAAILTYAFSRKSNIITSITAHMLYNGSQYILMLISLGLTQ